MGNGSHDLSSYMLSPQLREESPANVKGQNVTPGTYCKSAKSLYDGFDPTKPEWTDER